MSSSLVLASAESVDWLNAIVAKMWPHIDKAVQKIIHETVTPMIRSYLPSALQGFHFAEFSLGKQGVTLGPIQIYEFERGIKMHMKVDFATKEKIDVVAGPVTLGLDALTFSGDLVVRLEQFIGEVPVIGGLVVYFLNPPKVTYDFSGLGNIAEAPGLRNVIRMAVDMAVASSVVLPNAISIPLATEEQGIDISAMKLPTPLGLLRIRAVKAEGLKGDDWTLFGKSTSDPFVKVRLGEQQWQSPTVSNSTDPVWPEDQPLAYFVVHDREQKVLVEVFDDDTIGSDDLIGVARGLCVAESLGPESALTLYPKTIDVLADAEPTAEPCGTLTLDFDFLSLVKGEVTGDIIVLEVKVDGVRLPAKAGDAAQVVAKIGDKEKKTLLVNAPPPTSGVPDLMRGVATRLSKKGMEAADIADVLQVETEVIEKFLGEGKVEQAVIKEGTPHHIPVETILYIQLPPDAVESESVELTLIGAKGDLASTSVSLSVLAGSENCALPGPLAMAMETGTEIKAEIGLTLFGTKHVEGS